MKTLLISIIAVSFLAFTTFFYISNTPEQPEQGAQQELASTNEQGSDIVHLLEALNIQGNSARQSQLILLFSAWIEKSPLDAIGLIQQLDKYNQRTESFNVALSLWAKIDIADLNEWLLEQESNRDMDAALEALSLAYSLQDHNSQVLSTLNIDLSNYPQAAFFADKILSEKIRESSLTKILYIWVEKTPNTAVLWGIEQKERTEEWLTILYAIMVQEFPVAAVNSLHLLEHDDESLIKIAIEVITDLLNYENYNSDLELAIQSLTPYAFREMLIAAIIPGLFTANVLTLDEIDQLISSLLPGDLRDELQQNLSFSWALRKPEEAAAYAESLTGESREKALDAVVLNWAESDIESTSDWLQSVEGDIDLPARTLSRTGASQFHLEIADTWANNISDGIIKSEAYRDVFLEWNKTHPINAAHYIIAHKQLHEDQKMRYLEEGLSNSPFSSVKEIVEYFQDPED